MQRLQSSAALAVSVIALFVALGGSALAISQIGTSQIQNGAVTTPKLANGAVTARKLANNAATSSKLANNAVTTNKLLNNAVSTNKLLNNAVSTNKLANNAVTGAKVADGSLTASDIAANTFLASDGTAVNSQALAGLPATDWVQGQASINSRRAVVPAGQTASLLDLGFGSLSGICTPITSTSASPTVGWTPTIANENYAATVTSFGSPAATTTLDTLNAIPAGTRFSEPNTTGSPPVPAVTPQSITYQISYTDGNGASHVATAWVVGRFLFGTGCLFSAQGMSTG